MTASRFGEIMSTTDRRDMWKLCESMYRKSDIKTNAVIHGIVHESKALEAFSKATLIKTTEAGLFVHPNFPFLGATPDALALPNSVVEVKCPYNARDQCIVPGPSFPSLQTSSNGEYHLKTNHKWYAQVQGQMACARKAHCYFVIYTFRDLYVEKISFNKDFFDTVMMPKLHDFYNKYWRLFLCSKIARLDDPKLLCDAE